MNDNRGARRGPGKGLLLLIPAALIIAKGAQRRRAMWASAPGEGGPAGFGHGHHRRFDSGRGDAAFRLPPRLESTLEAWHTRTHRAADSPDAPTPAEPSTA